MIQSILKPFYNYYDSLPSVIQFPREISPVCGLVKLYNDGFKKHSFLNEGRVLDSRNSSKILKSFYFDVSLSLVAIVI